jgi:hippurate hydrolase
VTDGRVSAVSAVLAGLGQVRGWQEDHYRDLHAHPELPHQEHRTAANVAARLRDAGCEVHERIGGTGVIGIMRNGDGPTVLQRADMDALPVREETGLAYASTQTSAGEPDGASVAVMHACGHDVHVTCLLGAITLMAERRDQWSGTLIAVFQPAEETADGSREELPHQHPGSRERRLAVRCQLESTNVTRRGGSVRYWSASRGRVVTGLLTAMPHGVPR